MDKQQIKIIEDINESLTVSLGGDTFIDANLLADTIKDVVNLVEYSKREISPNTNVRLEVEAFQSGSFIVFFKAIVDFIGLENLANMASVGSFILDAIPALFMLARFLKGKMPQRVNRDETSNTVHIQNHEGANLTVAQNVYNIYSTPDCNSTMAGMFNRLESDGTRDDFRIKTKNVEEIVNADEFGILAKATSLESLNNMLEVQTLSNATLIVRKPDLAARSQWGFYFNKQIDATIEDSIFIERVHSGDHHFGANDRLIVDLRVETVLDERGLPKAGTERYFVERVHEHVPYVDRLKEDQLSFDDIK